MQNLFSKNLKVKFFAEGGNALSEESTGDAFGLFSFDLNKKCKELLNMESVMIGDVFIEEENDVIYMIGLIQEFNDTKLTRSTFKGISVFPIKIHERRTFLSQEDVVNNNQAYLSFLIGRKLKFLGNIYMNESKKNMFDLFKHKYSIDLFNNLKSNILYLKLLIKQNMDKINFHNLDKDDVLTLRYNLSDLNTEYALYLERVFKEKKYCVSFYLNKSDILSESLIICDKSLDLFVGLDDEGQTVFYGSDGKKYLTIIYLNPKIEQVIDSITVNEDEQKKYKEKLLQFLSN